MQYRSEQAETEAWLIFQICSEVWKIVMKLWFAIVYTHKTFWPHICQLIFF